MSLDRRLDLVRVLYVSRASVVPAYQDKLAALASNALVDAVIPARWHKRTEVTAAAGAARVRTARVLFHGHNHLHVYRGAGEIVRSSRPDIVHLDEEPYSAVTFQFARVCRAVRTPFVFFTGQNLDVRIPPPFGAMKRYVMTRAAAAIAGTDRAAAVLRRAGLTREIAVIPQLGVDPEQFRPDPAARSVARAHAGIEPPAFVVGFAGRLVPEQGVDVLLRAVASVDGVHALVIGDGPLRAELRRRSRELGIDDRTYFAGRIESLEMPLWLNALDVLVLPSRTTRRWSERLGRVLIEAMACGVPVVGAASGDIPGVIGHAGIVFPEGDATMLAKQLAELRDAAGRREQLRTLGLERVLARFTQYRVARETVALYLRVLSRERDAEAASGTEAQVTTQRLEDAEALGMAIPVASADRES